MKKIYNKLIRDDIPQIIKKNNQIATIRKLDDKEFVKELFKKLEEEAKEVVEAQGNKEELIKEISDVYEIIDNIIKLFSLDKTFILKTQEVRRDKKGSFKKKLFLESVEK